MTLQVVVGRWEGDVVEMGAGVAMGLCISFNIRLDPFKLLQGSNF